MGFTAVVQSATEGDYLGLTITNSEYLPIEWWTEDASATYSEDYLSDSQSIAFLGQHNFSIATFENTYPETIESLKIHVMIVGHPDTEIVLEADIFDDDLVFSPQQVTYYYDAFDQLIRRTYDPDGPSGSQPATDTFFSHHGGQIALQFDSPTATYPSHRCRDLLFTAK